jgi:hypothetical protein
LYETVVEADKIIIIPIKSKLKVAISSAEYKLADNFVSDVNSLPLI